MCVSKFNNEVLINGLSKPGCKNTSVLQLFFFQCDSPSVVVYIDYYVTDYGNLEPMLLMSSSPAVACCFSATTNKVSSDDGMFYIQS